MRIRTLPALLVNVTLAASVVGCEAGENEKTAIPLNSIYATIAHKSHKRVGDDSYQKALDEIVVRNKNGASSIFLVEGKDIAEAVRATRKVILAQNGADVVYVARETKNLGWVVVYFGFSGSSPPEWTIQSVERTDRKIRVTYKQEPAETLNSQPYYFWIPLGELNLGRYELEIFNQRDKEVNLMRRVKVIANEKS